MPPAWYSASARRMRAKSKSWFRAGLPQTRLASRGVVMAWSWLRSLGSLATGIEPIPAGAHRGHIMPSVAYNEPLGTQHFEVEPIGWVESPPVDLAQAPRQGDEGAPPAWLVFEQRLAEGLRDLHVGDEIVVLTWRQCLPTPSSTR